MRIGIVCYPTAGGSGVVATELALALADRGHSVHVISYAPPMRLRPWDDRVRYHEVEVTSYPLFRYPPYDAALASRLAETAEEEGLDVVHVHYAIPHTLAALLARDVVAPRRLPVVTTLHGTDITIVGQDRAYASMTRHAIRASDAVTAVSEYLRAETDRVFGALRAIDVIPNFIDPARFQPRIDPVRRRSFARPTEALLLHVSNFRPVKRAVSAVEVLAAVVKERPAVLLMVGEGPDHAACEARARELGVRDRVRFVGTQPEVETILPLADLLLLPSEYESFGLAALEAMACGTPPICFASGGLPEVVKDGVEGVLAPPCDDAAMARAVLDLLAAPEKRKAMAEAARAGAVDRFSVDRIVPRYEAVYRRVVGGADVSPAAPVA
jgi:N-acetyl-alpha-D-glucosaminyl L-malate synthase BshA